MLHTICGYLEGFNDAAEDLEDLAIFQIEDRITSMFGLGHTEEVFKAILDSNRQGTWYLAPCLRYNQLIAFYRYSTEYRAINLWIWRH
jgi:hypothetical protein